MGIVVGGELRDPDALSEALKAFFAKNKLPRKGVRLGIANNRIGVRVIDIAGVDEEKQLANAIHFRAQEALPIPLDEAVLDYHVLDESTDPEGSSVKRVLLVVAYKELVERYVDACRKAGLTLAGVDLEAFALLRSLAPPADRGTSALVAVSIGYDRSTFAVSDGQFCEFTRVLEWGGQSLNVALARAFNSEPSAVEAMKRATVARRQHRSGRRVGRSRTRRRWTSCASRCSRSHASSSPRSSSTRTSPAAWASARSPSPAARRRCRASPRSSSG